MLHDFIRDRDDFKFEDNLTITKILEFKHNNNLHINTKFVNSIDMF